LGIARKIIKDAPAVKPEKKEISEDIWEMFLY